MLYLAPWQVSVTEPGSEIRQQKQFQKEGCGCPWFVTLMFYSAKGSLFHINISKILCFFFVCVWYFITALEKNVFYLEDFFLSLYLKNWRQIWLSGTRVFLEYLISDLNQVREKWVSYFLTLFKDYWDTKQTKETPLKDQHFRALTPAAWLWISNTRYLLSKSEGEIIPLWFPSRLLSHLKDSLQA